MTSVNIPRASVKLVQTLAHGKHRHFGVKTGAYLVPRVTAVTGHTNYKQGEPTMGSTYQGRKATFAVKLVKGQRVFTPVNRRAKIVARKLGKRTRITLAEMRQTQGKGSYTFYAYTSVGKLVRIKV